MVFCPFFFHPVWMHRIGPGNRSSRIWARILPFECTTEFGPEFRSISTPSARMESLCTPSFRPRRLRIHLEFGRTASSVSSAYPLARAGGGGQEARSGHLRPPSSSHLSEIPASPHSRPSRDPAPLRIPSSPNPSRRRVVWCLAAVV
jgi:hypothetical protein